MNLNAKKIFLVLGGCAVTALAAGAASLILSVPARATEQFASETHKACGACHQAKAGGGALTAYGDKFKSNGNQLPKASAAVKH